MSDTVLRGTVLLVSLFLGTPGHGQETLRPIVIGGEAVIESRVLNESRRIFVGKPPGYEQGNQRNAVASTAIS